MWAGLGKIFASPVFEDEEKTRVAGLLNSILPAVFVIASILTTLTGLLDAAEPASIATGAITAILALVLWFVMQRGYVQLSSILLLCTLLVSNTLTVYFSGTIRDPITTMYVVFVVLASLLMGTRVAIVFGVLVTLAVLGLLQAETAGLLPPVTRVSTGIHDWVIYAAVFGLTTVLLNLATRSINEALGRAHSNEQALAERAREIVVFRELAGNAADAILMSTLEGSITYANRMGCRLFGYDYKQQEMVGLGIADLTPSEGSSINEETIITTWHSSSWRGEFKCRRKDGSFFDAFNTIFPVRDETGEPIALGYIIRDATEQKQAEAERERLQQEVIEAQRQALLELSAPVIPVMDTPQGGIIVMPLVGSIDSMRARDVTRALLAGIREHRAKMVILDITGVPVVDSGVANYLNKTILTARLKGAGVIVTGISDAVAETIVDLGIDWSGIETRSDLQTGLITALGDLGIRLIE